jgi:hypothetical protein
MTLYIFLELTWSILLDSHEIEIGCLSPKSPSLMEYFWKSKFEKKRGLSIDVKLVFVKINILS